MGTGGRPVGDLALGGGSFVRATASPLSPLLPKTTLRRGQPRWALWSRRGGLDILPRRPRSPRPPQGGLAPSGRRAANSTSGASGLTLGASPRARSAPFRRAFRLPGSPRPEQGSWRAAAPDRLTFALSSPFRVTVQLCRRCPSLPLRKRPPPPFLCLPAPSLPGGVLSPTQPGV